MKNILKKAIVMIVCATLVFQCLAELSVSSVQAENNNGSLSLSASEVHKAAKVLESAPRTFDATIQITSSSSGVIMGSYEEKTTDAFFFQVNANGVPQLSYYKGDSRTYYSYVFDAVDVRSSSPIRLTIVREAERVVCYINGVEKQSLTQSAKGAALAESQVIMPAKVAAVGGDLRPNNTNYFKGTIYKAAMWSDARSANEVSSATYDLNDSNLLAAYDFTTGNSPEKDLSGHGYDLSGNLNIGYAYDGIYTNTPTTQGIDFSKEYRYEATQAFSSGKYTMSAWVYLPRNIEAFGGHVLSNFCLDAETVLSFSVKVNGIPQVAHTNNKGELSYIGFPNADVRSEGWTHYAFTVDEVTNTVSCYVNGNLKETKVSTYDITLSDINTPFALGSDLHDNNRNHFTGKILDTAVYKTVLSSDEIMDIYLNGVDKNDSDLMGYYNLVDANIEKDIKDLSGNNIHMYANDRYFTDKEAVTDYAYSFAVVGDVQKITIEDCNNGTNNLDKLFDWIVANKDSKKINQVIGLGDITDMDWAGEWNIAQKAISKLDGKIAYSMIRGNHDALKTDSTTGAITRDRFSDYIGTDAYKAQFANGGFKDSNLSNSWRTFTVGEVDYLLLCLDWHHKDDVIEWADGIISSHPNHNVIVVTHVYVMRDGELTASLADIGLSEENVADGTNTATYLWDNLLSKHKNVVMVLSGHFGTDEIVMTQTVGDHGNVVTNFLIDPQEVDKLEGATGLVAMFYFSEDGKNVQVEYISTIRNEYFLEDNQFNFELAVVGKQASSGGSQQTGGQGGTQGSQAGSQGTSSNKTPTGDQIVMLGWMLLLMASLTGFGIYSVIRKEERNC